MAARRTRRAASTRLLVAIALTAFVGVTAVVVWRRSVGVATAREMRRMELERRSLLAQRVTLENDRRRAMSRAQVLKEAEQRLGLHVATEAQTRALPEAAATAGR